MVYVLQNLHWFILLIGAMVLFHELGHFLVAKACNIKVLKFSLGMGPKLVSVVRGETEYRVGALPLGGYVKMLGELSDSDVPLEDANRAFSSKPLWQRAAVVLAGPLFNFLLAFLVYFFMFLGNHTVGDTRLGVVTEGDPAWQAGLRPGDRIIDIDGVSIDRWGLPGEPPVGNSLVNEVGDRPEEPMRITFERSGQTHTVSLVAAARQQTNAFREKVRRGKIGVSLSYLKPVIGVVDDTSPAALAGLRNGDLIVEVSGQAVETWRALRTTAQLLAPGAELTLLVTRDEIRSTHTMRIAEAHPTLSTDAFSGLMGSNAYVGIVSRDTMIASIEEGSPAADAGLQVDDRLLHLTARAPDGTTTERDINVWGIDLATAIDARSQFTVRLQRGRDIVTRDFSIEAREELDELKHKTTRYVFGAHEDRKAMGAYLRDVDVSPFAAAVAAGTQVGLDTTLIGKGIGMLFQGRIPLDSMGGPIMMFVIAEKSAKRGWQNFLRMMAIISVNLGLLNLLPVPVLDGGHLMFFLFEGVRRRPMSMRTREIANAVGLILLFTLMVFVFSNDIFRFAVD